MRKSRTVWWVGGLAFLLLILVLACGASGFALQQGVLPPIQVTLNAGMFSIVTVETDDEQCQRPIRGSAGPSCSSTSIYNPNRYFIVWFQRNTSQRLTMRERYSKLLVIRLPAK
jgi:hypothetical protein